MNRKQKIIVSTTGIFLVLLILVGLTYAYFLTRINGNTNDKSISVSTANLELKYDDIEQVLISEENVEPGKTWTKKFSATNTGSKKVESYGVALENVINTLERTEDLVYTLNCTSSLGTNCNKVEDEQEFPTMGKILVTNSIESKEVQSYELTITYKDQNVDQSVDMNKQFSAKVNIVNPSTFNPYANSMLSRVIMDNEKNSTTTEKVIKYITDDYGVSYYYTGNVNTNYVDFAGMCWRIVRIAGDKSIKLILEDQDNTCETADGNWNIPTKTGGSSTIGSFGYTTDLSSLNLVSNNHKNYTGSFLALDIGTAVGYINYLNSTNIDDMVNVFKNFQTERLSKYLNKLKAGDWCLDDVGYNGNKELSNNEKYNYYRNSESFSYKSSSASLKCIGTLMTKFADNTDMYVGTLTVQESNSSNNYLTNNYQKNKQIDFWTMTPKEFNGYSDLIYYRNYNGNISTTYDSREKASFRPSVQLNSVITISNGTGTKSNPYQIK